MPIFTRNISGQGLFTWTLWEAIERKWFFYFHPSKKKQMERWHLHEFQNDRRVTRLAQWLTCWLARKDPTVCVRVESIWVDHTPQAEAICFDYQTSKTVPRKCELADLLLIVEVRSSRAGGMVPVSRRGMLIQSKVTDQTDRLDATSHDPSTTNERDLLECCAGPVAVRRGVSTNSQALKNSPYHLVPPGAIGLDSYARYQLTPRRRFALPPFTLPYQTLWPVSRSHVHGTNAAFETVLLEMTGLLGRTAGESLLAPARQGWIDLVDDLLNGYRGASLRRFQTETGTPVARIADSGYWQKFSVGWALGAICRAVLASAIWKRFPTLPHALFAVAPPGYSNSDGPPKERSNDNEQGDGPHISTIIVTIYSDLRPEQTG